jgi:hypothetical protein
MSQDSSHNDKNIPPRIIFSRSTTNVQPEIDQEGSDHGISSDFNNIHNTVNTFAANRSLQLEPIFSNSSSSSSSSPPGSEISNHDDSYLQKVLSNSSENSNQSKHLSYTDNYKRLSIFSNDSQNQSFDHHHVLPKLSSKIHSNNNNNSNQSLKKKQKNKRKSLIHNPLKISIPHFTHEDTNNDSNDDDDVNNNNTYDSDNNDNNNNDKSLNLPELSPIIKTPISFKEQHKMEDDLTSALDDALFSSAWMPTHDSNNKTNLKVPNNYSLSNSTASLRRRRHTSSNSNFLYDSFSNDIEANDAIPLKDLNLNLNLNINIPTIQVDNYLENSNISILNNNSQQFYSHQNNTFTSVLTSPNKNVNIVSTNNSVDSLNPTNDLLPPILPKIPNLYKIFENVSMIVNSDSIEFKYYLPSDSDNNGITENDNNNDDNETPLSSVNLKQNIHINHNKELSSDSLLKFYMEDIEKQNKIKNLGNDLVSVLHPKKSNYNNSSDVDHQKNDNNKFFSFKYLNHFIKNENSILYGNSLKFFTPNSKIRQFSYSFVMNPLTNEFAFIFLCVQVALTTYQQWSVKNGYVYHGSYTWVDWVLFIFYLFNTFEMFNKIIAFGIYDDSQMIKSLKLQRYENELQKFYKKTFKKFKNSKFFKKVKINKKMKFNKKNNEYTNLNNPFYDKNEIADPFDDNNEIIDPFNDELNNESDDNNEILYKGKHLANINDLKHKIRFAYLRTDWNRIDFVSILSFWIAFGLEFNSTDTQKVQIFRSLMCLRILRLLNISKGSRMILRGLKEAAIQSQDVLLFLLSFWILFSVIGVESFKSSLRRHCVWTNPNNSSDIYINAFQFCGSYLDPITLDILPFIDEFNQSSKIAKGFACPVNSKCIIGENPYNGRVSFDNVLQSMQSVFVIMSANTFTDLMYYTMDSDSMAASLFYITAIFVLVVWLVNLFVAVIINSYQMEDETREPKTSWFDSYHQTYNHFIKNSKIIKYYRMIDWIFVLIIFIWFVKSCTKSRINGLFPAKYNKIDFITSIILMVEIFIRFCVFSYAGNWRIFFYSGFNITDLLLAIFALVFSLPPVFNSVSSMAYGWLSVFGIIRFYRVILFIKPIKKAWEAVLKRTKPIIELILFSSMFLLFISLIMSRLFEGVVPTSELNNNPWIMYNLPNVIVSLFIITTTENWTEVLYIVEEFANSTFSAVCYAVCLIFWFFLSNTVLLSIVIAIITSNLELPEAEKRISQIKQFVKSCVETTQNNPNDGIFDLMKNKFDRNAASEEANNFINRMNEMLIANGQKPINVDKYYDNHSPLIKNLREYTNSILEILYYDDFIKFLKTKGNKIKQYYHQFFNRSKIDEDKSDYLFNDDGDNENNFDETNQLITEHKKKQKAKIDRSLWIFTNENPFRRFCQMLVAPSNIQRIEGRQPAPKSMHALNVFMFLSSVVCVTLACYETPLYRKAKISANSYHSWMIYPDIVFMVIFTLEFFIKIIADGFILGIRAYLKSAWNCIDYIVLISFWVSVLSLVTNNYSLISTFGALRALRAFRLLTITKESQTIFHLAVISGAVKILSAALVSLSLLVPFSLWGLNIFNQELSNCADGTSTIFNCSLEFKNEVFQWEIVSPNYVQTPQLNFDSFGASLESLFEILSLEGWVDLLGNTMNIAAYSFPSQVFSSPGNGMFVIIFIFVATMFIINLFISLIINNYKIQTGIAFLNNEQYGWYEVKKVLSRVRPSKRRDDGEVSDLHSKIDKFVTKPHGLWQRFIKLVLLMHFCVLLSECFPDISGGALVRSSFFVFTTASLLTHMLLMQYILGFRVFYSNKFNMLMTFILISALTLSCIAIRYITENVFYNIYKVFLVAVLCLVIPQIDALNQLFKYGSAGLFSLISLLYTWLVLFLVFAIALNQIFGLTRLGPNTTGNLNARTVTKALIMLFRNSFGEGWNYIMNDFGVRAPYCFPNGFGDSDCGNRSLAAFLFIVWNILSMYIFLNIMISVVISNFSYVYHGSGPHKLITREEIRKFKRAWNKLDINGSGYIYDADLYKFLHSLDGVLSYHVYPKYISLPTIADTVLFDKNPINGYDFQINLIKLEEIFSLIDFESVRTRRRRYERLVFELLASAKFINRDNFGSNCQKVRKISFSNALLVIGYYSRFEDSTCLNLQDFLRHSAQIRLINRELRKQKVISTIKMIFTRFRYKYLVDKCDMFNKLKNATSISERELLRDKFMQYLRGSDLPIDEIIDDLNEENDENPLFNGNLYRVMSQSSANPFSDAYVTHNDVNSFISNEDRF